MEKSNKIEKLSKLKLNCKFHNSEIGGVCDDFTCKSKLQLLCVKCVTESQSCIRQNKHNLIPVTEFVNNFFNVELNHLRKDFDYSKSFPRVENYLENSEKIIIEFSEKMTNIHKSINLTYTDLITQMTKSLEDFNSTFDKFCTEKLNLLKDSLDHLNEMMSFEYLSNYNIENLKDKMCRMPVDNLNSSVMMIKNAIRSVKKKEHVKFGDRIHESTQINEEIMNKYKTKFDEIEKKFVDLHNSLKNSLNLEILNNSDKKNKNLKSLNDYKIEKEFMIDFSANSNFLNKKFTLFETIKGVTILAYPTSQNTIKLENFDKIMSNDVQNLSCNLTINGIYSTSNTREEFLITKLASHGSRIIDLLYYRYENSDFLLSSSEDKSIKIWDLTDLSKPTCKRTLIAHENRICCFAVFYDCISSSTFIVSIGYGDRIKVWNFSSGEYLRDFNVKNNSDNLIKIFHHDDNKNYVITSGDNFSIRIWDFDSGKVIKSFNYPKSKIVSILDYYVKGEFLIIDENDKSCIISIDTLELTSLNLDNFKTDRVNALNYGENKILISCKNGWIYEYDLDKREYGGKFRTGGVVITHMTKLDYLDKELLLVHSVDQKLKILI